MSQPVFEVSDLPRKEEMGTHNPLSPPTEGTKNASHVAIGVGEAMTVDDSAPHGACHGQPRLQLLQKLLGVQVHAVI